VRRAGQEFDLRRQLEVARRKAERGSELVIGRSLVWRQTVELAGDAGAAGRSTVLLRGESGPGKEVLAAVIPRAGPRTAQPFVTTNVASIPMGLIEAELFGHEAGAFTGATSARRGLLELAFGGTLFLDEIGEMPLEFQARLLRVLEGQ